eukprot:CAMPEP_0170486692 /NCGR_PEP_ID=MMETSP0208-20121228/5647_1 /TAXON_ID=197538 /ORGANISM="Strombidium inclinatum, Strain S3" /LENGTH=105 /DNA_ID=CAMNT_0010760707 /DNA_START=121 /DNA_END=435 /DNA_ORIENTATION=+
MSSEQQLNHAQVHDLHQIKRIDKQYGAKPDDTSLPEDNLINAEAVSGENQLRAVSPKFLSLIKSPVPQTGSDDEYANILSGRNLTGGWKGVVKGLEEAGAIKKTP